MAEITVSDGIETMENRSYARLPGWKGALQGLNARLISVEEVLLYTFLGTMFICALSQWFIRAFFGVGYIWMGELAKYSMLWAGFLGASIATSKVEHFRIDLVRLIKNPRTRDAARILSYLAGMVVCIVFAYATFLYIGTLFQIGERSTYYGYPIWPIYTVVLYFYAISALRFFFMALMKCF